MAIDLNGSSVAGQSYVTSYREDDPAIGIVASDVHVGTESATYNTDNIRCIRIRLEQPCAEDTWQIAALPLGVEVRLAYDGPALTLPAALSALIAPSLYLRSLHPVSDVDWQNALKAISFSADEAHAPTRTIEITAQNNNNAWQLPVATEIHIIANNDAPVTFADTGEAVEAGGVNNTLPGSNATGNVLSNDVDFDGPSHGMVVSAVAFGESTASPGTSIQGAYGTLTIQADGSYTYVVNEDNAVVQSLRNEHHSVTDTFGYTAMDSGGASRSSTLTITIKGQDDTPFDIAVGHRFDGTSASVIAASASLGESRDFTFELRVSPTESITLPAQSLSGVAGTTGQEYAVTPLPGWTLGDTGHVGVGLSVGTNGISVYQHAGNLLSSLLTWSGSISANTHVAVVFHDNQPHLYVNGALVASGLQSDKLLHPPTELGGNDWGYFDGSISDFVVWHGAFSPEDVAVRALDSTLADDATPALTMLQVRVPENVAEGTVATTVRARDVDNSDALTYSLTGDAQGRFQIDSVTGEVRVAPGAVFDHETARELTLTARVTDLAGRSALHSFTVTIGDINEAPLLANDAANASAGIVTLMVDQDHGLWWLDAMGGQRSFIGTASAPITALASTGEGFHFAVSADTLYRLDPATGHCLAIGPLSVSGSLQMTGLTSTPDGALFGVNTAGDLYLISSLSGSAQRVVTLNSSVSSNGDVAYANGALYWTTASGNLMRYEPATNQHRVAMSGLPTHGGLGSLDSLMAADDNTLYAVDDIAGRTYRINLVDFTFTPRTARGRSRWRPWQGGSSNCRSCPGWPARSHPTPLPTAMHCSCKRSLRPLRKTVCMASPTSA